MQLLNESQNIQIWNLTGKQISLDKNGSKELFCKIVMGDVSDNISAIFKKCGPKTALKCFEDPIYFEEKLKKENALEKKELNQLLIDFNNIPNYLKEEYLNKFKVL
jgi:5'-3' exonuclease